MDETRDTRVSLLSGLRNSHDTPRFEYSWERFNEKYTPRMYSWARRMGLSQADAEEVCQDMMLSLLHRLKTLEYNPAQTFRGWLRTVTRNAVIDFINARKRLMPVEGGVLQSLVEQQPLEEEVDRFFDSELLELARQRAEQRLTKTEAGARNWRIFVRLELERTPPDVIAEQLNIRRHAVYVARNRVLEILKEEVGKLNATGPWL